MANECIAGEVNQRLFEAASSGCLPVSERQPPGVETLFVPGTEALYYENVLELDEHLRCRLFGDPRRPAVCGSLRPSDSMCGGGRMQALEMLRELEVATAP